MPAQDDLAPLAAVLDQIQARLSAIEGKVGIDGPPPPAVTAAAPGALTFVIGTCIEFSSVAFVDDMILPKYLTVAWSSNTNHAIDSC